MPERTTWPRHRLRGGRARRCLRLKPVSTPPVALQSSASRAKNSLTCPWSPAVAILARSAATAPASAVTTSASVLESSAPPGRDAQTTSQAVVPGSDLGGQGMREELERQLIGDERSHAASSGPGQGESAASRIPLLSSPHRDDRVQNQSVDSRLKKIADGVSYAVYTVEARGDKALVPEAHRPVHLEAHARKFGNLGS